MRLAALSLAFGLLFTPALAGPMLVNSSLGDLYLVDPDAGTAKLLSKTPQMFDIAISGKGQVIGVTGHGHVLEITPKTGKTRQIGRTGEFINSLGFDLQDNLIGAGNGSIYRIDLATGLVEKLLSIPGFLSSGDLAAGPDGAIYATSLGPRGDQLYRIDPGKGSYAKVGDGIGAGRVYGMAMVDGRMIGMTEANQIVEIDLVTGKGRSLGAGLIAGNCYGAASIGEVSDLISS